MKKIAIMQPYFFPYVGYFSLIKHVDEFILFDTPQFMRHGWIERNRILKQDTGWLYIKVPLQKRSRQTIIKDVRIDNSQDWQSKIMSQLQVYKKTAPYYDEVSKLIVESIKENVEDIVKLNQTTLRAVCKYLDIKTTYQVYSEMKLNIEKPNAPDEWALNICRALGDVSEYYNPPGGKEFFNKTKYDKGGIKLVFLETKLEEYDQKRLPFEAGLSIIDILMFNTPKEVNKMLDDYELS